MRRLCLLLLLLTDSYAATLTGTLGSPTGTGNATGVLKLTLNIPGVISGGCGGGLATPNTQAIVVINGALQTTPFVMGNDCLSPISGSISNYNVQFIDPANGLYTSQWIITGSSVNVAGFTNWTPAPIGSNVDPNTGGTQVNSDWAAVSGIAQILNKPTIPAASNTLPIIDGVAAIGTGTTYARNDHAHPTDTTRVATATTVNGHPLSGNVVVSATDISTGTLPHAQLPALISGDIPPNSANTSGTAAGLAASYIDWNAVSGGAFILNKPTIPSAAVHSFGATFDGGTSALTTAAKAVQSSIGNFNCTMQSIDINGINNGGTITFDIWKVANGSTSPTIANTITASALPSLSTGGSVHITNFSGWLTTSVLAFDRYAIAINAVSLTTYADIKVNCQ